METCIVDDVPQVLAGAIFAEEERRPVQQRERGQRCARTVELSIQISEARAMRVA